MKRQSSESDPERPTTSGVSGIPSQASDVNMAHEKSQKRVGKRPGRKPSKIDQKAKLERSRQSARECRARKKLRYQYLEELVSSREKAVFCLRDELEMYKRWCRDLDMGRVPDGLLKALAQEEMQKSMAQQTSPHSQDSTPTASPASIEMEHSGARQFSGQHIQQHGVQPEQVPGQVLGQHPGHISGQPRGQQTGQLNRQPSMMLSGQPQMLASMHKGSRSFEDASRSSSSSSSSVYRTGSVPNLASSSAENLMQLDSQLAPIVSNTTTLVYKDLDSTALSSTGFSSTDFSLLGSMADVTNTERTGNIPTLVSHHSPPPAVNQPSSSWTWNPGEEVTIVGHTSYPVTCASSVPRTSSSSHSTGLQGFRDDMFSSRTSVSSGANFTVTSGQYGPLSGNVSDHTNVPYYQRPRSSSDITRRVTATATSSSTSSVLQQNLAGLFPPGYGSQNVFTTISDSVATNRPPQSSAPRRSATQGSASQGSVPQDLAVLGPAPVCVESELIASISEPIPHWYSFIKDLENATRQEAFSEAGTPTSSRNRSGPGTPSSVDSPYSQQQSGGTDGNIPNIITDLLGDNQPS